jgi:hypothetical protein
LFDNNHKFLKTIYIGSEVGDGGSTAFLMEGAKQPYVMFVPGFEGSVRTRFIFDINEFESRDIFNENPDNIAEVTVKYPLDRPSSFHISKKSVGYNFYNPYDKIKLPKQNDKLIEAYLNSYSHVVAEYNDANNVYRDTILLQQVFCEISLIRKDKSERSLKIYSLSNIEWNENKFSPKDDINDDTRYIIHSNDNQLLLAQHRVIKKILLAFDSFAVRK